MRYGLMTAAALTLFASSALADDVVVAPAVPGVVVEHHDTVVHDNDVRDGGCTTKTVKKENAEGDSVSKTKSDC